MRNGFIVCECSELFGKIFGRSEYLEWTYNV